MKEILERIIILLYADEPEEGVGLFLQNAMKIASVPGAAEWVNPLFDAVERQDYIYVADILKYKMLPQIA